MYLEGKLVVRQQGVADDAVQSKIFVGPKRIQGIWSVGGGERKVLFRHTRQTQKLQKTAADLFSFVLAAGSARQVGQPAAGIAT